MLICPECAHEWQVGEQANHDTKVRNIRLVDGDHDIDCKIEGFGPMKLKSECVKRA